MYSGKGNQFRDSSCSEASQRAFICSFGTISSFCEDMNKTSSSGGILLMRSMERQVSKLEQIQNEKEKKSIPQITPGISNRKIIWVQFIGLNIENQ